MTRRETFPSGRWFGVRVDRRLSVALATASGVLFIKGRVKFGVLRPNRLASRGLAPERPHRLECQPRTVLASRDAH